MSKTRLAILSLALSCSPLVADWPQFRGPGGQGVSSDKGLPLTWSIDDNRLWKTDLPGGGNSCPIVVGNKIYLTTYSGFNLPDSPGGSMDDLKLHLVCLNLDTGKVLFVTDVKPRLPEQASIREGHGYASGTPIADGERIYASFGKSGLFAFDRAGKELWKAEIGNGLNGWAPAHRPSSLRTWSS